MSQVPMVRVLGRRPGPTLGAPPPMGFTPRFGDATAAQPLAPANMVPQSPQPIQETQYSYQSFTYLVTIPLAASGASSGTINMAQDTEFEFHELLASVLEDPGTAFNPNFFNIQITDQRTTRTMFNQQLPQRMACGSVYFNTRELRPIIFPRNGSFQIDLTNLTTDPITVTIGLKGFKVFPSYVS